MPNVLLKVMLLSLIPYILLKMRELIVTHKIISIHFFVYFYETKWKKNRIIFRVY